MAAVVRFEAVAARFDVAALRRHAERFDRPRFTARLRDYLDGCRSAGQAPPC